MNQTPVTVYQPAATSAQKTPTGLQLSRRIAWLYCTTLQVNMHIRTLTLAHTQKIAGDTVHSHEEHSV